MMVKRIIFSLALMLILSTAGAANGSLVNLKGGEVSYNEIVSSPKTALFLWTTWCPYCRIQMNKVKESYPDTGINFFFINCGEQKSKVKSFLIRNGMPEYIRKNTVIDKNSIIAKKFYISGLPTFIFFKEGVYAGRSHHFNSDLAAKIYRP